MLEQKVKRVGYEWHRGEDSKILHLSVKVPRAAVPEETGKHVRAAWREVLLAVRTLVDVLIAHADRSLASENGNEEKVILKRREVIYVAKLIDRAKGLVKKVRGGK
ncbi:MAG: hypothetical protein KAW13_06215 [Dehalococcoidia bacterium]|nr:hypothetical protein [Dehalococcoidia bacterium]